MKGKIIAYLIGVMLVVGGVLGMKSEREWTYSSGDYRGRASQIHTVGPKEGRFMAFLAMGIGITIMGIALWSSFASTRNREGRANRRR